MAVFPKSKRYVETTFTGAKNVSDAIDKVASVALAFGFGDPTGTTPTIAAAVSLSAKAVGAVSTVLVELAKNPAASGDRDQRTTLVLCISNEAYLQALSSVLSPRLSEIGTAEFSSADGSNLEATLTNEESEALLRGQCSLFDAYEQQLKGALRGAGVVWSEREKLAEEVSERARNRFKELLSKSAEPYATLRNRLNNEALEALPRKVVDEIERRGAKPTSQPHVIPTPLGLPVPPLVSDAIEPVARGVQALQEQLARVEQHLSSTAPVQTSAAFEVSVQLRANKTTFDRAKILLDQGKLTAAASLFETVVDELLPFSTEEAVHLRARAMANIGHCCHRQGSEVDAIRLFREAHVLAPSNVRLRVNAAVADLLEKNVEAAEATLHQLHAELPNESDVLELLAEAMFQRGARTEALALLESSPRSGEHYLSVLSALQLNLGRIAEAEKSAHELLLHFPESHQAQFAVALAIASPILNREDRAELISSADRVRLREAASHLDAAVTIARREEQRGRLAMYLSNLCGVRSAIGEHDAAVAAGLEARGIDPNDLTLLQNLFVAQIMLERYDDAAATARQIGAMQPGTDAVSREMHALIGASRYEQALAAFHNAAATPGVDSDPRLLALRVECLRKRPDLDAAEGALAEAYTKVGRVMELLLEEAWMRSVAHQHALADQLFAEAERVSEGRDQVVARRRYGLYLHRRRRWAEAATRLIRGDEDPVMSVVATEYLQCLFELKRMPQVVEIGRGIIAAGIFRPAIWEMTAQALAVLGQLKDAEKLFHELVQHEPTEHQHLALAGICYRSRGLNAAIKVLEAAQIQHPTSYYVHANLSGLYFARREYRKAFDAAKRAIEIAPNRQEGHVAMVRILGAGNELVLSEEEKLLLQESLGRSKAVRQFQMKLDGDEIDLTEVIEVLKEQSAHAQQAMQVYREKRLPVTMMAVIMGRPLIDVWLGITRSTVDRVFVASGTYEEQNAEHQLAGTAADVILDASALLTLQSLGLLPELGRRFSKVHVATATFEKFSEELDTLRSFAPSTSSMGYEGGRIQIVEYGPELHAQKLAILEEIVDYLESDVVSLEGLDEKSWTDWQDHKAAKLGAWILHPILIAKAKGWVYYSDEQGFRSLAQQSHGVAGFSTQAFMRALLDRQLVDDAGYHRAVLKLIAMNFDFISLSLNDILYDLKESGYVRTEVFGKLLRQLQTSGFRDEKSPWILGGVVGHLWFERSGNAEDRAEWIGLCVDSLNTAKDPALTLLHVLSGAGAQLAFFPEAFTALMHFLCDSRRLSSELRRTVEAISFELVKVLANSARGIPHPVTAQRWRQMVAWFAQKQLIFGNRRRGG